jgi:hypothetical protein
MKCKVCRRELCFYLPTGEYFHNTGDRVGHEAVVDKETPAAPVVALNRQPQPPAEDNRDHCLVCGKEIPPGPDFCGLECEARAAAKTAQRPAVAPRPPLRSRHDVAKRRTAAWEALRMARKFFPWRLAR